MEASTWHMSINPIPFQICAVISWLEHLCTGTPLTFQANLDTLLFHISEMMQKCAMMCVQVDPAMWCKGLFQVQHCHSSYLMPPTSLHIFIRKVIKHCVLGVQYTTSTICTHTQYTMFMKFPDVCTGKAMAFQVNNTHYCFNHNFEAIVVLRYAYSITKSVGALTSWYRVSGDTREPVHSWRSEHWSALHMCL